ncbi:MAG: ABC transporter ATP-binding protein, partial [Clostridia bacterium]|nr:ABC transporter ATP-binding protein [Clostridia bacterium]
MKRKIKTEEKSHSIKNYFFMLRFITKHSPFLIFHYVLSDIMTNLPWLLSNVVLLKYIIDVVTQGRDYHRIFIAFIAFAVLIVAGNLYNTIVYEIYVPKQKEKLHYKLYTAIYEKAAKMDFESYDDPEFYNDFVLAMNSMSDRTDSVISSTQRIFSNLFSIFTITAVIATIDPMSFVFVFACVGIMVPIGRLIAKVNVEKKQAMTPLDRKNMYFSRVFYLQDYAKELRLNPAGKMIERRYAANVIDRLKTISPFLNKQCMLYFSQDSLPLTILISFGVTLYMGYRAIVTKEIGMGDFAATVNGVSVVSASTFALTTWFAVTFRENGLYVEKFKK